MVVSRTIILVRMLAATYQSVFLGFSLFLYACVSLLRVLLSVGSRLLRGSNSRRRIDEMDEILKRGAAIESPLPYAQWIQYGMLHSEMRFPVLPSGERASRETTQCRRMRNSSE